MPQMERSSKLRFVHSLSTAPMLIDCYGIGGLERLLAQVWYYSLSVAYLKRIGGEVVLHTDALGHVLLGHLPYAEIHESLTGMYEREGINPRFWAAGKFVALKHEAAPCVHIDGDVFIKRADLAERIAQLVEKHGVAVQGSDAGFMYTRERPLFESEPEFCRAHHCTPDGTDALNTGLLGFGSDELRAEVTANYIETARYFSERHKEELDADKFLTPDLIAEQKMLEGFCRHRGLTPGVLLEHIRDAMTIGYQHVFTIDKFNQLPNCIATLRAVDPRIYARTAELCGE